MDISLLIRRVSGHALDTGQLLQEGLDGSSPLVSVLTLRGCVGVGITAVGWVCPWQGVGWDGADQ